MSATSLSRADAGGCKAGSLYPVSSGEGAGSGLRSGALAKECDSALPRRAAQSAELPAKFGPVSRGLLGVIWLYRHSLSPVLPIVCGPGCGCRFQPTCAGYAADAVRTYGALRGSWLAVRRLLKCHPWHTGGFDPVPPLQRRGPTCRAVLREPTTS
jgi:putative membrane protein insertion efficiency factor